MSNDNNITANIARPLWTVKLNFRRVIGGELPSILSDALEDVAVSVLLHNRDATDGDDWTVTLTTMGKPDISGIYERINQIDPDLLDEQDIVAERLPEKDWLKHVHDNFPPIKIGSFFIYGSHYDGSPPEGFTPLKIDAATAFGSGEHETTRGCIQALEYLKKKHEFKNGLDMGCGSGILAIAMTKLWPQIKVTAIDIDAESIVVTRRHAEMNNAANKISSQAGDGYQAPLVSKNALYDVITANILANPLIDMAPDLAVSLTRGGFAVLSGLLKRQKADVAAAHEKQGLKLVHAEEIGDWQALVLQKPL